MQNISADIKEFEKDNREKMWLFIQSVFFYAKESSCLLNLLTIIRTRWLISHFNPIIRTLYILN